MGSCSSVSKSNAGTGGNVKVADEKANVSQVATNAKFLDKMNETQLDNEIAKTKREISRLEKIMQENDTSNTEREKAMKEYFPLGVGGGGWTPERLKQRDKYLETYTKKAKIYTDAFSKKQAAETSLESFEKTKEKIKGTGKTLRQIREEKSKAAVKAAKAAPKTLKWSIKQKGGWEDGGYAPKIIKSGNFEIRGTSGFYRVYKDGKEIGSSQKLSVAKALAEKENK